MPLIVGVLLAVAVGLMATSVGLDRDRAFYPTVTIVIAFLYSLFAVMGESTQALALELLERECVVVHPGYFFDFPHEAYIVVSLIPVPDIFADAFSRVLRFASTPGSTSDNRIVVP